jgi:hypothetical protein
MKICRTNKDGVLFKKNKKMQEEELRARNAREQAVIQKRLAKGPRNASPLKD